MEKAKMNKAEMARRIAFLKAKCFSKIYEHLLMFACIPVLVVVYSASDLCQIPVGVYSIVLIVAAILYYKCIFKKEEWISPYNFLPLLKSGCLLLYPNGKNSYTLTMCGKLSHKTRCGIVRYFDGSFEKVCGSSFFSDKREGTVCMNTHAKFARGALKVLKRNCDTQRSYSKLQFEKDTQKGYAQIDNFRVLIEPQKKRKNKMLASAYPFWPTEEQLADFETKNTSEDFFVLRIPTILFEVSSKHRKIGI